MDSCPRTYHELDQSVSNLDLEVPEGLETRLKAGNCFSIHYARDFCGYTWWDAASETFKEEIWQWHRHIDTLEEATLVALVISVNDTYGCD